MVCIRCKMVVKDELKKFGLLYTSVELGEVELLEDISPGQLDLLRSALLKVGLEVMDDKKNVLVQKIKKLIVEVVHYNEEPLSVNLSEYLSQNLGLDYTYLANVFSEAQGISVERFYIMHRIERVKKLLVHSELSITEIAYKMHYSSVSHLSSQFKKVTGLTPSHFKKLKSKRRSTLEDI